MAGLGGLGSNAAVSLARSGISKLIIADFDHVEQSNLNRQYYFQSDIGKTKVDALSDHLKNINPDIIVEKHHVKLTKDNMISIMGDSDLLIEAFDKASEKKWLIETWAVNFKDKPVIAASGLSGMGKTEDLKVHRSGNIIVCGDEITDISEGLCAPRVSIVANMQANLAIEWLVKNKKRDKI